MRIRNPSKIFDHFWYLGNVDTCIYLLEGARESILINAGLSFVVPDIIRQFQQYGIDESKIKKILLLHSHFDHVGIVPFLKRRNPEITVLASSRACKLLQKPKVLESINSANRYVIGNKGLTEALSEYDLDWTTDIPVEAVGEGDRIDIGGMEITIYETPGHSPCHISAHVPMHEILFPSEAGGLPCGEKIITYGTSSYTDFENSIQKLKDLPARYICSDHYGYVTGDEALNFITDSIRVAKERRLLMESIFNRTQNVDRAAEELVRRFADENQNKIVPDDIFLQSHRQMVLHVIGKKG